MTVDRILRSYFQDRGWLEPVSRAEERLTGQDRGREIVAYCRGPYCVLSYEAVAALRARGFKIRRLEDGYPEWRTAGLPVEEKHPA